MKSCPKVKNEKWQFSPLFATYLHILSRAGNKTVKKEISFEKRNYFGVSSLELSEDTFILPISSRAFLVCLS